MTEGKYIYDWKEYWIKDLCKKYDIFIEWNYVEIKLEEKDKWSLFRKDWWPAIEFNWKTEFYRIFINWDYIKIQFEKW
jgi:hypothetical protein